MGEVGEEARHRREAERFRRLADLSVNPALKSVLIDIAGLHRRIADQLIAYRSAEGQDSALNPAGTGTESQGRRIYQLRLIERSGAALLNIVEADSDITALRIAYVVQDACSDVYTDFELWQESRFIARGSDGRGAGRRQEILAVTSIMQDSVLRTEELLLNSGRAIASSRKLLEATQRLRGAFAASGDRRA